MSFAAMVTNDRGLGQFGPLRRMLETHWGVRIEETYMGEAVQICGNGYTAGIHFESLSYKQRTIHKIEPGRAYNLDQWKAAIGPIQDDDTVTAILFNISGAGDSFDQLCSFCRQHGFELREQTTNDLVDQKAREASVLYSLYQLDGEISAKEDS